jgi:hypothetical protein
LSLEKSKNYVIYGLFLFGYWILSSVLIFKLGLWVKESQFITNKTILIHQISSQLIFMGLGILLGLEQLIKAMKQTGRWSINKEKIIILGIPSVYFTFYYLIHFFVKFIAIKGSLVLFLMEKPFLQVAAVIFGYVITTSFYKEDTA